jgi:uncharacterized protein YdiU (UPF0061 family)
MAQDRADHTITWRRLAGFSTGGRRNADPLRDLFIDRAAFDAWAQRYRPAWPEGARMRNAAHA